MKKFALVLCLAAAPASAQQPAPELRALGEMIGGCQQREASALIRLARAMDDLAAEKARADEAEAKLKAKDAPAEPAK